MSIECNFSFSDLYKAAYGKNLSKDEKKKFINLSQEEINNLVLKWAKKAGWKIERKRGNDKEVYIAFHP
jgi:hypothetical protein